MSKWWCSNKGRSNVLYYAVTNQLRYNNESLEYVLLSERDLRAKVSQPAISQVIQVILCTG